MGGLPQPIRRRVTLDRGSSTCRAGTSGATERLDLAAAPDHVDLKQNPAPQGGRCTAGGRRGAAGWPLCGGRAGERQGGRCAAAGHGERQGGGRPALGSGAALDCLHTQEGDGAE
jgi:hypothetical protein